jgi:hypothetical protein
MRVNGQRVNEVVSGLRIARPISLWNAFNRRRCRAACGKPRSDVSAQADESNKGRYKKQRKG